MFAVFVTHAGSRSFNLFRKGLNPAFPYGALQCGCSMHERFAHHVLYLHVIHNTNTRIHAQ